MQQHPYERIATPFQVFTWIARQEEHTLDCVRTEEMQPSHMGPEEHAAGQVANGDNSSDISVKGRMNCRLSYIRTHVNQLKR